MATPLAALRQDLDVIPSPEADKPGFVLRDSLGFSSAVLFVPAVLAPFLQFFNGQNSEQDLVQAMLEASGDLSTRSVATHLVQTLSQAGMLDDARFAQMRQQRVEAFRAEPVLSAAHFGPGNYPEEAPAAHALFAQWLAAANPADAAPSNPACSAIAAPHASPEPARRSYGAAYAALARALPREAAADKTFLIFGTSHYGEPDQFGLTQRNFQSPLGEAQTDRALTQHFLQQAPSAVAEEDYCFAIEHSLEFQIVLLQHLYGPQVRIWPVLCGSFGRCQAVGIRPEEHPDNRAFFSELGNLLAKQPDRYIGVLGVDMAHIGNRYGDREPAIAMQGPMREVQQQDEQRLQALAEGSAARFWELHQAGEPYDLLRWCGSAPLYTWLHCAPEQRAQTLSYEQWQIDPGSVVSYAALTFTKA